MRTFICLWWLWKQKVLLSLYDGAASTAVPEVAHPWCDLLTDTQTLHTSTQVARAAANTSFETERHVCTFSHAHTHTCTGVHTATAVSCTIRNWSTELRLVIPPPWGNRAGVRSQWPLGKLEVQSLLFSTWDPPAPPPSISDSDIWVEPPDISSPLFPSVLWHVHRHVLRGNDTHLCSDDLNTLTSAQTRRWWRDERRAWKTARFRPSCLSLFCMPKWTSQIF